VASNPSCIGIGLGEDTGMLVTGGNQMEAIGSGLVMIIDGHEILHSNIADIPEGNPISVERIIVHFCAKGNGFLLRERHFVESLAETTPVMKDIE
jgi:cyanophycinase